MIDAERVALHHVDKLAGRGALVEIDHPIP